MKRLVTILLLFLMAAQFLVSVPMHQVQGSGENWLEGWNYRKSHMICNSTGAGSNYQVNITTFYGSGSDSGSYVYLHSRCQTTFADVRFTDNDGSTLLDICNETCFVSVNATFWVEVQDDLSSQNVTIYIYYGNAEASSVSNGDNTFLFFDDFLGSSLNASKWTSSSRAGGTATVSGGYVTIDPAQTWDGVYIRTVPEIQFPNCAVEMKYLLDGFVTQGNPNTHHFGTYFIKPNTTYPRDNIYYYMISGAIPAPLFASYFEPEAHSNSYSGTTGSSAGTRAYFLGGYSFDGSLASGSTGYWRNYAMPIFAISTYRLSTYLSSNRIRGDAINVSNSALIYSYYSVSPNATHISGIGSSALIELLLWGYYVPANRIDWVFVRKCVFPEPQHDVWGEEEVFEMEPPTYSNVGQNSTMVGTVILFHVFWQDNFRIVKHIFGWNFSGTWENDTEVIWGPFSQSGWSNITKEINDSAVSMKGYLIQWCVWAKDLWGNANNTGLQNFTLTTMCVSYYFTTGGTFRMNNTDVANSTITDYGYGSLLKLAALPFNSSFVFVNFTWTDDLSGYNDTNPYNLTLLTNDFFNTQNITLWCYFDLAGAAPPAVVSSGGMMLLGLTLGCIFTLLLIGARVRKRKESSPSEQVFYSVSYRIRESEKPCLYL